MLIQIGIPERTFAQRFFGGNQVADLPYSTRQHDKLLAKL